MLIALLASTAFALPNYPDEIAADLGMPCTPTCDLCHSSAAGGGVPTTPFGTAMINRGMTTDMASLAMALDMMVSDAVDSDGDTIIDTEELAQGMNPNGGTDYCADGQVGPTYGCLSSAGTARGGLFAALLGLGAMLLRRRRG